MIALALTLLVGTADLQVGDVAPDFTIQDVDGKTRTLSDMVKHGPVILAFYPKAGTSGCTQEMTNYTQHYGELQKVSAQVLAISTDDVPAIKTFRDALQAPYIFVSDPDNKLLRLYNVKMPVVNYAKRTTFVVDGKQHISKIDAGSDAIDVAGALKAAATLAPKN